MVSFAPQQEEITHSEEGALDLSSLGGYSATQVNLLADATTVVLPASGSRVDLIIVQGTGGQLITWPGGLLWPSAAPPVLSVGAGERDWVVLLSVGGVWHGTLQGVDLS